MLSMLLFLFQVGNAHDITVRTSRGVVHGFHFDQGNDIRQLFYGNGDVFLGIPYALPPTGELRFKLPRPICRYDKEINATAHRPRCTQYGDPSSVKDCLHLNIYSPNASSRLFKYPVMVWIPGGGFTTGAIDRYSTEGILRNLVSRGVVVVSNQYRVGILGFFTTYTADFPANRGIFDQIVGLRWVKEEISNFGGDVNRITVFGESAGAISISALSLSPLADGYPAVWININTFETPDDPRGSIHKKRARQYCKITDEAWRNTTGKLGKRLQDCFSNKTAREISMHDYDDFKSWSIGRDGVLLPDDLGVLAKRRRNIPFMIGDTLDEYAFFIPEISQGNIADFGPGTIQNLFLRSYPYLNESILNEVVSRIVKTYELVPLNENDHLGWAKVTVQALSDMAFSGFARRDAGWSICNAAPGVFRMLDRNNPDVFLFTFNYPSSICYRDYVVQGWRPVKHTDELCFLFFFYDEWKRSHEEGIVTAADLRTSDNIAKAWTDFAKTGYPGWHAASKDFEYTLLNDKGNVIRTNWREDGHILSNIFLPQLLGEFPSTSISPITREKLFREATKLK